MNLSTTIPVTYTYSEMSGGANNSRLTSMAGGWQFDYLYGSSGSLNDSISRLAVAEMDGGGWIESFGYLGLGTVVRRTFDSGSDTMTYIGMTPADAGDQYVGLDRFGRIADQRWINSSNADVVNDQYGYDRDSNRLYQKDTVNSATSELYAYDGLNQLTSFARGTSAAGSPA